MYVFYNVKRHNQDPILGSVFEITLKINFVNASKDPPSVWFSNARVFTAHLGAVDRMQAPFTLASQHTYHDNALRWIPSAEGVRAC